MNRFWIQLAGSPARWMVVLGLAGVLFVTKGCHDQTRRPDRVLIPDGYVGWIRVEYGVHNAPPLPIEQGFYLIRIPPAGVLRTSSEFEDGKWVHTEYDYYLGNHRRRLEQTGWGGGGMIWDGRIAGMGYDRFIGTEKEYRELNASGRIGPLKPSMSRPK